MVVWLIGLSGAGKTTLAREIWTRLKTTHANTVLLDGDELRDVFGNDLGHTVEDRRRNADRLTRLCRLLNRQGIHVVCAVLSIFHESQRWNREQLRDYFEVYVETPFEHVVARDSRGIYGRALRGELANVVGVDIPFPPPYGPDLVIRNRGSLEALLGQVDGIIAALPGLEAVPS